MKITNMFLLILSIIMYIVVHNTVEKKLSMFPYYIDLCKMRWINLTSLFLLCHCLILTTVILPLYDVIPEQLIFNE